MQILRGFQAPSQELESSRSPGPADHQKNSVADAVLGTSTRASVKRESKFHAIFWDYGPEVLLVAFLAALVVLVTK